MEVQLEKFSKKKSLKEYFIKGAKSKNSVNIKITYLEKIEIDKWFKSMQEAREKNNFNKYFDSFKKLCSFIGIDPNNVMISQVKIKKYSKDLYVFSCHYNQAKTALTLPKDTYLFHNTTVKELIGGKLIPQFMGKSDGLYGAHYYSCPRIFVTCVKNLNPLYFDIKPGTTTFKYLITDKINKVFIDPALAKGFNSLNTLKTGAFYIETKTPVAACRIDKLPKDIIEKLSLESDVKKTYKNDKKLEKKELKSKKMMLKLNQSLIKYEKRQKK